MNLATGYLKQKYNIDLSAFRYEVSEIIDPLEIKYPKSIKNYIFSYDFIDDFLIFEYLLKISKKNNINIIDLGSGWGKWSIIGYKIFKLQQTKNFQFINVEALKDRHDIFFEILNLNKFDKINFKVFQKAITSGNKKNVSFYGSNIFNWYGQSITINKKFSYFNYILNKILNRQQDILNIETINLSEIVKNKIIELCIMDIQGLEYNVIKKDIGIIGKNINHIIIGTHNKQTEMSEGLDTHKPIIEILESNNFNIVFECDHGQKKNYNGNTIMCPEDGIIVAKNNNFS